MSISEISVQDLADLGPGVRIVDVREPDEWADGHIATAVHVPLGTVPDSVDAFDGSPTYVICRSGGRSMRACELLSGEHDLAVVNVTGGMLAWLDAGLPAEAGSGGA